MDRGGIIDRPGREEIIVAEAIRLWQVKRRCNFSVGVSSVIVGHEAATTRVPAGLDSLFAFIERTPSLRNSRSSPFSSTIFPLSIDK